MKSFLRAFWLPLLLAVVVSSLLAQAPKPFAAKPVAPKAAAKSAAKQVTPRPAAVPKKTLPKQFLGAWAEAKEPSTGQEEKPEQLVISEGSVTWTRSEEGSESVPASQVQIEDQGRKLAMASRVVYAKGAFLSEESAAAVTVSITLEGDRLLLAIPELKQKSKGGGLMLWRGGTTLRYEEGDKYVPYVSRPAETHTYDRVK